MNGLMKTKLAQTLVALILLAGAVAIPLSGTTRHYASADGSSYPANIEYDHNTAYGWYEQSNLTNPNIGAVDINMNWSEVEPQQGTFNWGPADQEMADWTSHGKKFTLIVRYVHELKQISCSVGNQWMPEWELARIPNFCSAGGEYVPDYFDATFKSDLQGYITAIAQHIAASPYNSSLEFVRIGVGMAGESLSCVNCGSADKQQLVNWGYSPTTWAQWQKEMLTSFKNIFSTSGIASIPLIYPLGDNDVDSSTGQPVSKEVGYWAASQGFGVGQQGLANSSGYANGAAVKIAQYVRKNYPSAYIEFQTVSTVSSASDVQGDITIAKSAGAFSIEWYATDSINAGYQTYFQQWQQTVDCTYTGNNCSTPSPTVSPSPSSTPSASPSPSPTPGTILAQDTLQRSNQSFWGTASDKQVWGGDANSKKAFSITNNKGQITASSSNNYSAVLGPATANAEVIFSGMLSDFTNSNTGAVLRWTNSSNWYKAYIDGKNLVLAKKVNGTLSKLKSVPFAASSNTSYTLAFSVSGTTLSASVWAGNSQPNTWMVSVLDTSFSSGNCGLHVNLASGVIADLTSFQAIQQ